MGTHSSILAWKIPWTGEPGRLCSPWGCKELDTTAHTHTHTRAHTHTHTRTHTHTHMNISSSANNQETLSLQEVLSKKRF